MVAGEGREKRNLKLRNRLRPSGIQENQARDRPLQRPAGARHWVEQLAFSPTSRASAFLSESEKFWNIREDWTGGVMPIDFGGQDSCLLFPSVTHSTKPSYLPSLGPHLPYPENVYDRFWGTR